MVPNDDSTMVDSDALSRRGLELLGRFLGADAEAVTLSEQVKSTVSSKGGKETILISYAWVIPGFSWIRLSEIKNSQGTFIYNLAALPDPRCAAPMIQAEFVVLRSKLFLIILELSPLTHDAENETNLLNERCHTFLASLTKQFESTLPPVSERMDWAEGVIDEDAFWSKPNTTEAIADGFRAFELFISFVVELKKQFLGNVSPQNASARKAHLIKVAEKFNANGPSKPFLETFFGSEWTENYLHEFFFPVELLSKLPTVVCQTKLQ
ncbi:MAG: hypothetical protein ACFCU1_08350 [Sumerlaeia bacterium]